MDAFPDPDWNDYNAFVSLRERGLRRDAFQRLGTFLDRMAPQPFEERKRFVCSLFVENDDIQSLPHPLKVRLVEPLLEEWIGRDPSDFLPHLWLGTISHLWEAHRLEPDNADVRWQLVLKVLKVIQYEMHELPIGFLGDDPDGSYATLLRLRRLLSGVSRTGRPAWVWKEIDDMIEVLGNLLDYQRDSTRHLDERFAAWCERLGRTSF
jgi:hypothetical protein